MLAVVHLAAYAVLALLAVIVARRLPAHRIVAAFVTWMLVSDLFRQIFVTRIYAGTPRPYTGFARVAFHVDEALTLSWFTFFLVPCFAVFVGRAAWAPIVAWALLDLVCLDYPRMSGTTLNTLWVVVSATSVVVAWACIAYGLFFRKGATPGLPHLILILYSATDVGGYVVRYAIGWRTDWPITLVSNMILLSVCIAVHVVWLVQHRRRVAVA